MSSSGGENIVELKDEKEEHNGNKSTFYNLSLGYPGETDLQSARNIMTDATTALFQASADSWNVLHYGAKLGNPAFREEVAKFLNINFYGISRCSSDNIVLTAGASHGLYFITTYFFSNDDPVFVEDPTYFIAKDVFKDDLHKDIITVPTVDGGIDVDALDTLLSEHCVKTKNGKRQRAFRFLIYTMPTFHNPLGSSLSPERSKQLVEVARKHNALVVCDDVYNMLYYYDDVKDRPKNLLEYDSPDEPDYQGGTVVSNCSFSKILGPGVRVGWIEAGSRIVDLLGKSQSLFSGGAVNQYTSMILATAMSSGACHQHLCNLKRDYAIKMKTACQILREKLPKSVEFVEPKGGYFIWIVLPKHISSDNLLELSLEKYKVQFIPGHRCSPVGGFKNCLRISISYYKLEDLVVAVNMLCSAILEHMRI